MKGGSRCNGGRRGGMECNVTMVGGWWVAGNGDSHQLPGRGLAGGRAHHLSPLAPSDPPPDPSAAASFLHNSGLYTPFIPLSIPAWLQCFAVLCLRRACQQSPWSEESLFRIAVEASGAIACKHVGTDACKHATTRASGGGALVRCITLTSHLTRVPRLVVRWCVASDATDCRCIVSDTTDCRCVVSDTTDCRCVVSDATDREMQLTASALYQMQPTAGALYQILLTVRCN